MNNEELYNYLSNLHAIYLMENETIDKPSEQQTVTTKTETSKQPKLSTKSEVPTEDCHKPSIEEDDNEIFDMFQFFLNVFRATEANEKEGRKELDQFKLSPEIVRRLAIQSTKCRNVKPIEKFNRILKDLKETQRKDFTSLFL